MKNIYYKKDNINRISQGDILKDFNIPIFNNQLDIWESKY